MAKAARTRRGTLPGTDAGKRVRRGGVCANLLSGSPRVRGALPTVQLLVNGQRRVAVIDSGCSCTIIHESCCASWRRCGVTVMAVNGSRLPSSGVTEVAVQLKSGGPAVTLSAVVVPDKPLGVDMLVGMTGIAALGGVTVRAADDVVFGASERPDVAVPGPGGVPPRCSAVTPPASALDMRLIPEFDGGNASVEEWLDKTELVCQLRGVSDIQTVVPLRLTGGAFSVYQQLKPEEKLQYSAVKAALLRAFAVDKFQAYEEFTARRLRVGESVDVYLADLRRLASLFGGLGDTALEADDAGDDLRDLQ
ncbi:hypothetical protein FJT64_010784 [Amphibalanus amphitrite]|uniref:Retrotransposon gag domain-containing protein n=1 Tax=Amphibalanus amphitrite TaxID=1232801 RepID=A0A6A4VKH6_AMPAM|nr:hypothetical protein FJT64_010784 [Amphibalanus amphitrite]